MATVCASGGGRMVLAQTVQNTVPINIRINNGPLVTLGVTKSISLSAQVSAQFANAFDQSIYVVPFGDQPGDIAAIEAAPFRALPAHLSDEQFDNRKHVGGTT